MTDDIIERAEDIVESGSRSPFIPIIRKLLAALKTAQAQADTAWQTGFTEGYKKGLEFHD
jgi:hypothetical protein